MIRHTAAAAIAALAIGGAAASTQAATIINSGFEQTPNVSSYVQTSQANVPGWNTTASDGLIEIWRSGFNGVTAYEGDHFAELNATEASALYQDLEGVASGQTIGFSFAHRGRAGFDTLGLTITDVVTSAVLFAGTYTTGNTAWSLYTGSNIIATGNALRFSFAAVSTANGNPSIGNFLDDVQFGIGIPAPVPVPASLPLLASGIALIGFLRRRNKKAA